MAITKIMISAGEASGDLHASKLIKELRILIPDVEISGLGGPKMREAGASLFFDMTGIAVVGFAEVLKNILTFKRLFNLFLKEVSSKNPSCVILIDYPGFNLALAKRLKIMGIKVIYYISPQIWAWHQERVEIIRKCVDKMIVVFRFEEEFYKRYGIKVDFVGHPLLDIVKPETDKNTLLERLKLSKDKKTITLLPGSREGEVKRLLPVMLESAKLIRLKLPATQLLILKSPSVKQTVFDDIIKRSGVNADILEGQTYDGLNISYFCIAASGTATLEAAIMEKPMVVIYKTSHLTYMIAKKLVTIPDIALVNVVAGRRIVPEFVQENANASKISQAVLNIINTPSRYAAIKEELAEIKETLQPYGASIKAANAVRELIS